MIGKRLQERLTLWGLTQQKAADRLGISQSRLNQDLKDKREPDSAMFCKICEVFEVTPNWLYGFDNDTPSVNRKVLETALLFLSKYTEKNNKSFSPEKAAKIVAVIYEIIASESEERAQKTIDWIIEAVA